jgi:hypothetical protein
MNKFIILIIILALYISSAFSATVFTYQYKETELDKRREYPQQLLQLALEKTIDKYGEYKLVPSPMLNTARAIKLAEENKLENFFVRQSVSKDLLNKMGYVPFPVDLGIVGYRVFFVSPSAKEKLKSVKTIDELKKFTIVQGIGWLDSDILKENGFNVEIGTNYNGLFKMVAENRVDLFPRGANELLIEYQNFKKIINIQYDKNLLLYYPLPRFFFTHKSNKEAIKRIYEGLIAAYEDGSLLELWNRYYRKSVEFANLKNRKMFKLENPFLTGIDTSYEKYIYKP